MTGAGSVWTKGDTQNYMREQIHFCGFLPHNEDGKSMIDQIISLFAHNSQNYQNHKSLELEIVVRMKRAVLVFYQQGYCLFKLFFFKRMLGPVLEQCNDMEKHQNDWNLHAEDELEDQPIEEHETQEAVPTPTANVVNIW